MKLHKSLSLHNRHSDLSSKPIEVSLKVFSNYNSVSAPGNSFHKDFILF